MLADVRELLNVQFFPFNFAVKKCRGFLRRNEAVIEAWEKGSDIRDHGPGGENGRSVTRALHWHLAHHYIYILCFFTLIFSRHVMFICSSSPNSDFSPAYYEWIDSQAQRCAARQWLEVGGRVGTSRNHKHLSSSSIQVGVVKFARGIMAMCKRMNSLLTNSARKGKWWAWSELDPCNWL